MSVSTGWTWPDPNQPWITDLYAPSPDCIDITEHCSCGASIRVIAPNAAEIASDWRETHRHPKPDQTRPDNPGAQVTNPKRVDRALADIHLIATLIGTHAPKAQAAFPLISANATTSERVAGGDISKPVEAQVMANTALVDGTWADCWRHLADAITALREADRVLTRRITEAQAGKIEERSNLTSCDACERVVANTPDDRLRSGYCTACYRAWDRAGRPDRTSFERGRRGIDTTARQVTINIAGVDHTLTQDQAERLGPNPTADTIAAIKAEIVG